MIYIWLSILCIFLVTLSIIDLRSYRLPDILTLPLMVLGVAQTYFFNLPVKDSLIGVAAGYVSLFLVEHAYRRLRGREGLGRGDAKLLAAGGAWCSWLGLAYIVLIASASGLIFSLIFSPKNNENPGEIPFGPFLSLGILVVWLAQKQVGQFF